jgi:poly [ADP-ribose] polymerase 6/8
MLGDASLLHFCKQHTTMSDDTYSDREDVSADSDQDAIYLDADDEDLLVDSDEEEHPFESDQETPPSDSSQESPHFEETEELESIVACYSSVSPFAPATLDDSRIVISFSRHFLPLATQSICGFTNDESVLSLVFEVASSGWRRRPASLTHEHPRYAKWYAGHVLVNEAITRFFSKGFTPKSQYQSASFLLLPSPAPDPAKVRMLTSQGFREDQSGHALAICDNHIGNAIRFISTGELDGIRTDIPVTYDECPLLFLVLEIADAFLGLPDHCCICGKKTQRGLKPSACCADLCRMSFDGSGVGKSLYQEIARDPLVADLLVSLVSTAMNSECLNPAPPGFDVDTLSRILGALPAIGHCLSRTSDDQTLWNFINGGPFDFLKWVLFSFQSHLISVPPELALPEVTTGFQFMTVVSDERAETRFNELKEKYGSCYLWHGSGADRWHSIMRNGLRNLSCTNLQVRGASYGPGIYLAPDSSNCWIYSQPGSNRYWNSKLGSSLRIMALVEVANVPELRRHDECFTLQLEEACVVRFLFLVDRDTFAWDLAERPPLHVPTFAEVLNSRVQQAKRGY